MKDWITVTIFILLLDGCLVGVFIDPNAWWRPIFIVNCGLVALTGFLFFIITRAKRDE